MAGLTKIWIQVYRDASIASKKRMVEALVFPVVMHGCESWTSEERKLMFSRRILRILWTARVTNHVAVLEQISPLTKGQRGRERMRINKY